MIKRHLSFRGYFDLYNIPFQADFSLQLYGEEKPFATGGLNQGPNIFDYLVEREHSVFCQ